MNLSPKNKISTADNDLNWFWNGITDQKEFKIVLKCETCGEIITTFYSMSAIIRKVKCETCHNIEKLKE